jgi:glutathione reductase (NADPH)
MSEYDFDFFVIGAGSGGVRAARMAAGYGARVAIAEDKALGGTCVNVGCVPKKLLVYASQYGHDAEDARAFGWSFPEPIFDWPTLIDNKNREIERLNGIYAKLLEDAGARLIHGRATLLDAHTVAVGEQRYRARYILLAVGGRPRAPKFPGAEHTIVSDQAFFLEQLPRRIVIDGGGYVASEFACIFRGFGCEVTQIYRGKLFLRGFDDDVRRALASEMRKHGIDLMFDTRIHHVKRRGPDLVVSTSDDLDLHCDLVFSAIGRVPNTEGLGLEAAGVATVADTGAIRVDGYSRTSVENIYAVGDVTNRIQLTPVALAEGAAVAATLFDKRPTKPDHTLVPSAMFTQPNVGTVGLTEAEAREHHGEVDIYRSSFRPLKHTLTGRDEKIMMKLIVHPKSDRVLGCHVVGPDAGEIIQGFAVALRCGASKAQFDATIGIHPTAAEELVTMRRKVQPEYDA